MIFEPDIFSNIQPKWKLINNKLINKFIEITNSIPKDYISELKSVYYSGSFEINSSNYKIEDTNGNIILLKKSNKNKKNKIIKTQKLVSWLKDMNIPVPESGKFINNSFIHYYDNFIWTY